MGNLGTKHDCGVVQKSRQPLEKWRSWSVGDRQGRLASGLLAPPPPLRSAPGCRLPPPQPQWLGQNLASCVSLNLGSRNNAASCVSLPHPLACPHQLGCPHCPDGPPLGKFWWEMLGDVGPWKALFPPEYGHRLVSSGLFTAYQGGDGTHLLGTLGGVHS